MRRGIALKQEALPTFRHLMRGLIKREALRLKHQNRSVKTTHWMVICLQVFRSPTCLNAGDAGGVEHPLHLSGAHRNCPQRPQLRRGEIHLVIEFKFLEGGENEKKQLVLPVPVHRAPVCVCTAAWRGQYFLLVQPAGVSESYTAGPLHKQIQQTQ